MHFKLHIRRVQLIINPRGIIISFMCIQVASSSSSSSRRRRRHHGRCQFISSYFPSSHPFNFLSVPSPRVRFLVRRLHLSSLFGGGSFLSLISSPPPLHNTPSYPGRLMRSIRTWLGAHVDLEYPLLPVAIYSCSIHSDTIVSSWLLQLIIKPSRTHSLDEPSQDRE